MPDQMTADSIRSQRYRLYFSAGIAFLLGLILASVYFTGLIEDQTAASYLQGFESGTIDAQSSAPNIERERAAIPLMSAITMSQGLEIELKAISATSNAIEIIYGEIGRERFRVPSLSVGDAVARELGNTIYTITNVSVAANLQRATLEVTKIRLQQE